ncbi:MAG: hypothetical protein HYU66_07005 [Armatimonadetes bacterium]|nr:hypothetical protein [Armatimonadota bacterium]
MCHDLPGLVNEAGDELIAAVLRRLRGRGEFPCEPEVLPAWVADCVAALGREVGAADGELEMLLGEIARSDDDPGVGYRRAQLLLDALCAETVELVRQRLARPAARTVAGRVRALVGPAQVRLAAVFRPEPAAAPERDPLALT